MDKVPHEQYACLFVATAVAGVEDEFVAVFLFLPAGLIITQRVGVMSAWRCMETDCVTHRFDT